MNTKTMLHYLKFAAENGFEYLLIDAGWYGIHNDRSEDITTPTSQVDLERIITESKKHGVEIFLWLFWQCVSDQMDVAFPLFEKWGVSGIKIDYMNRDDHDMVIFYNRVIKKAAQHHLLVDFHGSYKPTGIRRTYPNLITREGVLGLEWSKWSRKCDPEHELHIPFTRMLAGPMDFTPGCFRTAMKESFDPDAKPPISMGTRCHQLAMYVVYESPLQMCVDYPGAYRNQSGIEFLKAVPTTWDTTLILNGRVGDFITVARKKGEEWFIGGMTDWTPRQLYLSLDFLGDGIFVAEIYSDPANLQLDPTGVEFHTVQVTRSGKLMATMGPGGGYAVRLMPLRE
jgi:alpha-glucosidase